VSTGSYQDLIVWRKSITLAALIYRLTDRFPREERYGLAAQLRRAAVSISANIAEGWGRGSKPELRFRLTISRGSLYEVESDLVIAELLHFAFGDELSQARGLITEVRLMLTSLRRRMTTTKNG
jgi:four helix bundle protein